MNDTIFSIVPESKAAIHEELHFKRSLFPGEECHLRIGWQSDIIESDGSLKFPAGWHVQAFPGDPVDSMETSIVVGDYTFFVIKNELKDIRGKKVGLVKGSLMLV